MRHGACHKINSAFCAATATGPSMPAASGTCTSESQSATNAPNALRRHTAWLLAAMPGMAAKTPFAPNFFFAVAGAPCWVEGSVAAMARTWNVHAQIKPLLLLQAVRWTASQRPQQKLEAKGCGLVQSAPCRNAAGFTNQAGKSPYGLKPTRLAQTFAQRNVLATVTPCNQWARAAPPTLASRLLRRRTVAKNGPSVAHFA